MRRPERPARRARLAALLLAAVALAGCASWRASQAGYYWQSASGHLALLRAARPVDDWLADAATPQALRQRLRLAQRLRDFAVQELALPDNASYSRYADLHREAAVWNVIATPELSLQLHTWCFPLLGCVGYRGHFDRADADALAARLRAQGLEAAVYGVPAYSTLGRLPGRFFADPLLNTFIDWPEGDLARMVFHELAHQVAYAADDTAFNESFATAVEQLGAQRWFASGAATPGAAEAASRLEQRRDDFRALVLRYRAALDALYRSDRPDAAKRDEKARLFAQLRAEHQRLKAERWDGYAGYDGWFARASNPMLAVQAAYHADVDAFVRLFEQHHGRFGEFYAAAQALARLSKPQRDAALRALRTAPPPP